MPTILSVAEVIPPVQISQTQVAEFVRELFGAAYKDIDRLLTVFKNGEIKKRHLLHHIDWFHENHSFEERNRIFIEAAVTLGTKAISACLGKNSFLKKRIPYEEIDAIFFITSTGLATPSIEARIMNHLPFHKHTKRIPIWGLGCAGGVAGLSRAYEYCQAFPKAKVLVLSVEFCSLTFQKNDLSKSNLIGTSLFADGVACALVCGDESNMDQYRQKKTIPSIMATHSTLMPNSLDVMGWDIKNDGLFVIFSRDIPHIVESWLKPNVNEFLEKNHIDLKKIDYFIAHPGGKKIIDAYGHALNLPSSILKDSLYVLQQYGNMSSATIFYVLKQHLEKKIPRGSYGLCVALGPGFSSELILLRWFE
jgi:alkylresorcinol/alkylpyrone synthase